MPRKSNTEANQESAESVPENTESTQEINEGNGNKQEKKKRAKRNGDHFNSYIYKVLKQVHPEIGVSKKAMQVLNSFVFDVMERLCDEASRLCHYAKKQTLGAREIQAATALVLPGELAKHAQSEGTKSVNKFMASVNK
mmetsp:Transcript_48377/g.59522  ORF Transcript_48377/g.59522 Transcript_48377/m.59522 type:complete len:139 (+) Transcript_48377:97-513(+)